MTGYPWTQGDLLLANDLNAAIADATAISGPPGSTAGWPFLPLAGGTLAGPLFYTATGGTTPRSAQDRAADVANVLDFGADRTGVADSTAAFQAALATGKTCYAPDGTYNIRNQLVVGPGQTLCGDGRAATTLIVDQTFSSTAASVISLSGNENMSPTVRDLMISFAQPSTVTSRASFLTLAAGGTSGSGGTGVMYPPAILLTASNRFRLLDLSVWGAWDGIINPPAHNIGGFILENVEMGALNCGLSIDNVLDFGHIKGYHFWPFGLNAGVIFPNIYSDGNTFGAKFGANGLANGITLTDFCVFQARVSVNTVGTWIHAANVMMDGNGATFEVTNCSWVMLSNIYFSGTAKGANTNAQLVVNGGRVFVNNMFGSTTVLPVIQQGGGYLFLNNSDLWQQTLSVPVITVGGTALLVANGNAFQAATGVWTTPYISVGSSAVCAFKDNRMVGTSSGDVGMLVLASDNTQHSVSGNFWNGWGWTPPGPLGDYGINSDMASRTYTLGGLNLQSLTTPTTAQLALKSSGAANSLESKLRFYGTFPTNVDYTEYLAASLRGGWNTTSFTGSYLNVWLTNAGGGASDTNTQQVASFTLNNLTLGNNNAAANQAININGAAGNFRQLVFETGGIGRWAWQTDNVAEGGSNTGSNINLVSLSDTGAFISHVLGFNRAAGTMTLGGAGTWTPNGSTAVSLTALAPAGAHATVQEWLTITDASGNVRYIPCF